MVTVVCELLGKVTMVLKFRHEKTHYYVTLNDCVFIYFISACNQWQLSSNLFCDGVRSSFYVEY